MTSKRLPLVTRRAFVATLSAFPGTLALACSRANASALTCTDVSALSEIDRSARVRLAYVDRSPNPERTCAACTQFLGEPSGCGSCKLVRGPIHPFGSCKSFAAKL